MDEKTTHTPYSLEKLDHNDKVYINTRANTGRNIVEKHFLNKWDYKYIRENYWHTNATIKAFDINFREKK